MQNWQFYLHMLAMCLVILLLYLFFREYKLHNAQQPDAKSETAQVATRQAPMSLASFVQSTPTTSATCIGSLSVTRKLDTESNLDLELSSEINDLARNHEIADDCASETDSSHTSQSNASVSSDVKNPTGSPTPQVIEFVNKKVKRRRKQDV